MANQELEFSEEEGSLAASQEEASRLSAENQYLKQRVVVLRAMINRLQNPQPTKAGEGVTVVE